MPKPIRRRHSSARTCLLNTWSKTVVVADGGQGRKCPLSATAANSMRSFQNGRSFRRRSVALGSRAAVAACRDFAVVHQALQHQLGSLCGRLDQYFFRLPAWRGFSAKCAETRSCNVIMRLTCNIFESIRVGRRLQSVPHPGGREHGSTRAFADNTLHFVAISIIWTARCCMRHHRNLGFAVFYSKTQSYRRFDD